MSLVELDLQDLLANQIWPWTERAVFALLIFLIGRWIARRLSLFARKLMVRTEVDELLRRFLSNAIYWIGLVLVIIAALEQLGVRTTSALAILGAAGLAIGLALKDSLSNVASGVMLILFRPFHKGQYVDVGGVGGTVQEVGLFATVLNTPDNRRVIVPNSEIYSKTITNYSANDTRRIDLVFGIGYDDDVVKAKELIWDVIRADERILSDPQTQVALLELADSSINLAVRPWVKTGDYWEVRFSLNEKIKQAFDSNGISIPFPQRDVHLYQTGSTAT